jgi:Tol biopolymer transport system component
VQIFAPQSVEALLLADLNSGKETVLMTRATPGMDPTETSRNFWADGIRHLSFSPDGKGILFSADGVTIYYPSNIYTLNIGEQSLAQLTHSTHIPAEMAAIICKALLEHYYRAPHYSPDGSQILLGTSATTAEYPAASDPQTGECLGGGGGSKELVATMKVDGSELEILAGGPYCFPHFWSADGQSIYYGSNCGEQKGGLIKMNLKTRAAQVVQQELPGRIFGRMPERDWVAFQLEEGPIAWYNIQSGSPVFVGLWSVPPVKLVGEEKFELKGFDWSRSGAVLLWYEGELNELFEVVRFLDGPNISR